MTHPTHAFPHPTDQHCWLCNFEREAPEIRAVCVGTAAEPEAPEGGRAATP